MIQDNMPHRIFKISELTRLIASELVLISRKSTMNLACACRCLEEPALSTLWETQSALNTLLEVLPGGARGFKKPGASSYAVCALDLPLGESNV